MMGSSCGVARKMPNRSFGPDGEIQPSVLQIQATMQRLGVPRFADPNGVRAKRVARSDLVLVAPVGSHRGILDESVQEHLQVCQ